MGNTYCWIHASNLYTWLPYLLTEAHESVSTRSLEKNACNYPCFTHFHANPFTGTRCTYWV